MKGSLMLNFIFFFSDVGIQVKILELFYVRRKDPVDFYIEVCEVLTKIANI